MTNHYSYFMIKLKHFQWPQAPLFPIPEWVLWKISNAGDGWGSEWPWNYFRSNRPLPLKVKVFFWCSKCRKGYIFKFKYWRNNRIFRTQNLTRGPTTYIEVELTTLNNSLIITRIPLFSVKRKCFCSTWNLWNMKIESLINSITQTCGLSCGLLWHG